MTQSQTIEAEITVLNNVEYMTQPQKTGKDYRAE